ncbi:MAG: transcription antitermination factor NusB [Holosporaceae bacterium]|jgi:N utilization substance protein B|nr:transcription antitermination factor NusB [Holosporaceae bacterium]
MLSKKERRSQTGLRGMARLCAVQTSYKAGFCDQKIPDLINEKDQKIFISENLSSSEMDEEFFKNLLSALYENGCLVDGMVGKHLSAGWKFERLDSVIKCILRLAITELHCFREIPTSVILNEYIEISKAFFEGSEIAFVNGLLNSAAQELRATVPQN